MKKQLLSAAGAVALLAGVSLGQTPADKPALTFEVASIKPVDMPGAAQIASGKIHAGMKIDAARVDIGLASLMDLVCKAYDVKQFQVQGPSWMTGNPMSVQRFDVIAKMPEGATKDQVPQMLQALLAERFKLVIHKEKKDQNVYALVVAKGGPKLKESEPLPTVAPENGGPTAASSGSSQVSVQQTAGGMVTSDGEGTQQKMSMGADGKMHFEISRSPISKFADGISPLMDRPIIDQTGLTGKYEISMALSMQDLMNAAKRMGVAVPGAPGGADSGRPADAASDNSTGGIFDAFQQMGLKLEPRKLPLDLIVIDKVEKMPTEN